MVILGEVLVVGGNALVVCSAIFWAWSAIKQRLLRGPNEALANRRKSRDDRKPRHGSGRGGSYARGKSSETVKTLPPDRKGWYDLGGRVIKSAFLIGAQNGSPKTRIIPSGERP